jgi:hypothetical protein
MLIHNVLIVNIWSLYNCKYACEDVFLLLENAKSLLLLQKYLI